MDLLIEEFLFYQKLKGKFLNYFLDNLLIVSSRNK